MMSYKKLNENSLPFKSEHKPSENNDHAILLHRLINEKKKKEFLELIKNKQITAEHIGEVNSYSENVLDHLCRLIMGI